MINFTCQKCSKEMVRFSEGEARGVCCPDYYKDEGHGKITGLGEGVSILVDGKEVLGDI